VTIVLTPEQARSERWRAQLLGGSSRSPAEVVDRAVALQGQDLPAVLRAIAIRSVPGTTLDDVRAAFDAGDLVRSWPMRGTLFATTPQRLSAMLSLTGDRLHRATTLRRSQLGLDDGTVAKSTAALLAALDERPLRRQEAMAVLEAAGVDTGAGRGYHLLMHCSVGGLVHWGPFADGGAEQLLVRTPASTPPDPDAALTAIVQGMVAARGPVTDADVAWWTKLPKTDVRRAAASIPDLVEVEIDGIRAWTIGEPQTSLESTGVTLVPGFDEWILGYADRSLVASPAAFEALVPGGNGVFRPAVLVDGVVVGSWRLPATRSARAVRVPEVELVERVGATTRRAIDRAVAAWPHA